MDFSNWGPFFQITPFSRIPSLIRGTRQAEFFSIYFLRRICLHAWYIITKIFLRWNIYNLLKFLVRLASIKCSVHTSKRIIHTWAGFQNFLLSFMFQGRQKNRFRLPIMARKTIWSLCYEIIERVQSILYVLPALSLSSSYYHILDP